MKLCSGQSSGAGSYFNNYLIHFLVGKSEFHRTRLFQRENDKLMRCYNISIRWSKTKFSFWHWYVITLWFDWKCPFCYDRFLFHFSPIFFFFWLLNTSISHPALSWEHSGHFQNKKLFLAGLLVQSHCLVFILQHPLPLWIQRIIATKSCATFYISSGWR